MPKTNCPKCEKEITFKEGVEQIWCPKCGYRLTVHYKIEKIVGDPVSYLMKRSNEPDPEKSEFEKQFRYLVDSNIPMGILDKLSLDKRKPLYLPNDLFTIVRNAREEFPKCERWDEFIDEMFDHTGELKADVWYDVLDNESVGEILDWMIEFMKVWNKYFVDSTTKIGGEINDSKN